MTLGSAVSKHRRPTTHTIDGPGMQYGNFIRFCEAIMRLRPTQLGAALKFILGLRRRVITVPSGTRYFADPVSLLGLSLMKTGCYEADMTQLIESMLKPADTFIDLGANEGYFSVLAGKILKQGKVLAIEPQSRLQPVLAENQRLNDLHNVRVCQGAVADREGSTALALRPSTHTGASSMFPYWRIGWNKETVRTMTLDQLFKEQGIQDAALMKVDCEGAEKLIFTGSIEVLATHRIHAIILEYHPQIIGTRACRSIDGWLRDLGYRGMQWRGLKIYLAPAVTNDTLPNDAVALAPDWLSGVSPA